MKANAKALKDHVSEKNPIPLMSAFDVEFYLRLCEVFVVGLIAIHFLTFRVFALQDTFKIL